MLDEYQRDEAILHFQRGLVLERAHRVTEAVEEYRRAIARYPHLREAHNALGFYYQRYGLSAKAAEEFRVVANLEDNFLSHFNLGYALLEIDRHDEALIAFNRCLDIVPDDPATHYEVAFLYFLQGNYQEALTHLQVALQYYAQDWEIHKLLGRCMLQLGRYDEARASFEQARAYALRPASLAEIDMLLAAVDRYREYVANRSLKDQLYANHGVVHLGSAQDDGIRLREAEEYHFTYPDIATTLRRLVQLAQASSWKFTSVVALDRLATPITRVLSATLGLPERDMHQIQGEERPLLVMSIGREVELLEIARERASEHVSFCLGLNWLRRSQLLPDITGVVVRGACSVPWEPELRRLRALGASAEQIERCLHTAAGQIAAATSELSVDPMFEAQLTYYTRDHRRLRFQA